jgi:hypothetical protein
MDATKERVVLSLTIVIRELSESLRVWRGSDPPAEKKAADVLRAVIRLRDFLKADSRERLRPETGDAVSGISRTLRAAADMATNERFQAALGANCGYLEAALARMGFITDDDGRTGLT